ncbi:hypothetical protein CC78DRAFT_586219 [Lojkania enalia]|uniref:Uncharacterized protein n=1 Tax=Lojkania enalia TaxID=147567 RepID=A0A9P4JXW2_9PLEO|nr:hypothetical protein CC78DRAFT_586219 [Didymosphaeria enalia]
MNNQQQEISEGEPMALPDSPRSFDVIPSPHNVVASLHGPPEDHPAYSEWLQRQWILEPEPIVPLPQLLVPSLNPQAEAFLPGASHLQASARSLSLPPSSPPPFPPPPPSSSSPSSYSPSPAASVALPPLSPAAPQPPTAIPPATNPPTRPRPKLVYTQWDILRGPPAPVPEVVERLLAPPPEAFKADGSVVLNVQWAVECIGYAHLEPAPDTRRATLKRDSALRTEATQYGIPAQVIRWLCHEPGFQGPILHVQPEDALMFW